ncbi:MAG: nucleotidyltransferase domain-containing protein [Actinomycetota bacterium]
MTSRATNRAGRAGVPPRSEDAVFTETVAGRLAELPGVRAVSLGGSRAEGTERTDSDWDFAIYYRDGFTPEALRAVGWEGKVSEIGGWGGGVFNGGAWLTVEGRRVDVHYRDLADIDHHLAEAREGRFRIERLLFHLAGVPTYIVVAELALGRVLHGELPNPDYPETLANVASERWWEEARLTLDYARDSYARMGRVAETAGAIATAACQTAHAIMAARREWVTNEKTLLDRAGLRIIDEVTASMLPATLESAVGDAEKLLRSASGGRRTSDD